MPKIAAYNFYRILYIVTRVPARSFPTLERVDFMSAPLTLPDLLSAAVGVPRRRFSCLNIEKRSSAIERYELSNFE